MRVYVCIVWGEMGWRITNCSAGNKDQKLVARWTFYRLLNCCPIEHVWDIWLIKVDLVAKRLKLLGKWPMADCYF